MQITMGRATSDYTDVEGAFQSYSPTSPRWNLMLGYHFLTLREKLLLRELWDIAYTGNDEDGEPHALHGCVTRTRSSSGDGYFYDALSQADICHILNVGKSNLSRMIGKLVRLDLLEWVKLDNPIEKKSTRGHAKPQRYLRFRYAKLLTGRGEVPFEPVGQPELTADEVDKCDGTISFEAGEIVMAELSARQLEVVEDTTPDRPGSSLFDNYEHQRVVEPRTDYAENRPQSPQTPTEHDRNTYEHSLASLARSNTTDDCAEPGQHMGQAPLGPRASSGCVADRADEPDDLGVGSLREPGEPCGQTTPAGLTSPDRCCSFPLDDREARVRPENGNDNDNDGLRPRRGEGCAPMTFRSNDEEHTEEADRSCGREARHEGSEGGADPQDGMRVIHAVSADAVDAGSDGGVLCSAGTSEASSHGKAAEEYEADEWSDADEEDLLEQVLAAYDWPDVGTE